MLGSSCSLSRTPAKGLGASRRSSPLANPLHPVGRMKVSNVGLLSLACRPSWTFSQSSSPVKTTAAILLKVESTHAIRIRQF